MKLTYDDFVRFPDDGQRHELIEGEPKRGREHASHGGAEAPPYGVVTRRSSMWMFERAYNDGASCTSTNPSFL